MDQGNLAIGAEETFRGPRARTIQKCRRRPLADTQDEHGNRLCGSGEVIEGLVLTFHKGGETRPTVRLSYSEAACSANTLHRPICRWLQRPNADILPDSPGAAWLGRLFQSRENSTGSENHDIAVA